jgi:hypothetical protein
MQKMIHWIGKHYDRLLALVVFVALVASLGYLAARVSTIRKDEEQFNASLNSLSPRYPKAVVEDVTAYEAALERVSSPFLVPESTCTNAMLFVPEKRCICVDCRRPIPYMASVCPFCEQPQPKAKEDEEWYDGDGDGMWDSWERANRLNPFDPSDAAIDSDGDGFPNMAEFNARTDPNDPEVFPPLEAELRIVKILANPFRLLFRSRIRLPDGEFKFGINTRTDKKTYFVKVGEDVEGFLVTEFEEKYGTKDLGGATVRVDESVVVLKRGDRTIRLIKGQDVAYEEYTVEFFFGLDGTTFKVKPEEEFSIRGRRFKLISVDTARNSVLIRSLHDGKERAVSLSSDGKEGKP